MERFMKEYNRQFKWHSSCWILIALCTGYFTEVNQEYIFKENRSMKLILIASSRMIFVFSISYIVSRCLDLERQGYVNLRRKKFILIFNIFLLAIAMALPFSVLQTFSTIALTLLIFSSLLLMARKFWNWTLKNLRESIQDPRNRCPHLQTPHLHLSTSPSVLQNTSPSVLQNTSPSVLQNTSPSVLQNTSDQETSSPGINTKSSEVSKKKIPPTHL